MKLFVSVFTIISVVALSLVCNLSICAGIQDNAVANQLVAHVETTATKPCHDDIKTRQTVAVNDCELGSQSDCLGLNLLQVENSQFELQPHQLVLHAVGFFILNGFFDTAPQTAFNALQTAVTPLKPSTSLFLSTLRIRV